MPGSAAKHVQVLRLQPGDTVTLFDGAGADWPAQITRMGRSEVEVRLGDPVAVDRELPLPVRLLVAMPANDRMDWLVEKATELGASAIVPLHAQRSVLRLHGERAQRKLAHWQAVAAAAAEQCGRACLTRIEALRTVDEAIGSPPDGAVRLVLSLHGEARPFAELLREALLARAPLHLLSGPEGGLTPQEEAEAIARGWQPVSLGPRVLRADTAPLAALAAVAAVCA